MQLRFSIHSWGAWAPKYPQRDDWQTWCKHSADTSKENDLEGISPALSQVPAMQRRRFSRLTKMMLDVSFQCEAAPNCRSIFASRHGELHRTIGLLEDIIEKQPLSPLGFSQSVHNTGSGIFGILTNNTAPSTSIAAGTETLSQAMVEAFAQLYQSPEPLLLVFGDDPVPPVYDEFTQEFELPLALGLTLAPADESATVTLTLSQLTTEQQQQATPLSYGKLIHALATSQDIAGCLSHWHWSLTHA
ncbi:beta-ketoacyl synthase chain length factor [Shewanella mangrovisoli]|uniref:beta-ketoacyl synthase chain length factor n=1 Tax=Shewanella mangrovisoli TaxID=2864211 RepID=UPI001C6567D7|nr:beta-ketoacyl synthase chain length factor [Shewanella mangrovisoli]QYK09503.1 beta-ketoacyl synthase chain length factor [Shewanella mangrovisoli]